MWLVDTNLLVYAVSPAEKEKQPRARAFLTSLLTTGRHDP
jgi:predicted nucleic acid-binding protein